MRGVVVPGAAPPSFSAGMGASGFFRTALRRTGMRAVRLRSASSGTKVSVKRARIGRAGPPLLLLPDAGAVVRIHGPLPATRGFYHPQCRLRTSCSKFLAPRHGGRTSFHLLPGPLAASGAGGFFLPGIMGSLAAGPVDLSWAGTGAAGGNRPLGNPEDGPLGADPPLPRLSGSGAGLPGNSPLLPVCGIQCPDGPVYRHARPTLQHIQSRRSGAIVRRIRPDALPASLRVLSRGNASAAVLPAGRPSAPSVYGV